MTAPHLPDLEPEDTRPLRHLRREGLEGYRAQLAVPDGSGGLRWVTVVKGRGAPAYVCEMQARSGIAPMLVWWDEEAHALRICPNPGGRLRARLILPNGLVARKPQPAQNPTVQPVKNPTEAR